MAVCYKKLWKLLIDKDMNTFEVNIPTFMLREINYDPAQVKNHATKKELTSEVNKFIQKHNQ